jgi:hypothetical protein
MSLFAEASIKLSRSVLDEFAQLIAGKLPEERYQQFPAAHPVLLDPLAARPSRSSASASSSPPISRSGAMTGAGCSPRSNGLKPS